MKEVAEKLTTQIFGAPPSLVEAITDGGKNNIVFKVNVGPDFYILRTRNQESELVTYQKEKWAAAAALEHGVPTPKILAIGTEGGYAFSFQEYIKGHRGTEVPEELGRIWHTLGRYANTINRIPAPESPLHYKDVLDSLFTDDLFVVKNIFSQELSALIHGRLAETLTWEFAPMLCHGNLHPSNVIINPQGTMYVIDWETATGNRTPQSELAEIYTWNNGKENIALFCDGYGLNETEVSAMMRDIQTLVLLRLVGVMAKKIARNPHWQEDDYIHHTRALLASVEDYGRPLLFTKNL